MKRHNNSGNFIDGNTLKKIKTLSFQLEKDDGEIECNNKTNLTRTVIKKQDISDTESSNAESDGESVHSFHGDEEELEDEDRIILEKYNNSSIAQEIVDGMKDAQSEVASYIDLDDCADIDPEQLQKFEEHSRDLIKILTKMKNGRKLPKIVKVLPQVPDWEFIIEKLEVMSWSPPAMKLLAHQFRAKGGVEAEKFYRNYLLPYVRENIKQNQRLDNELFQTLKDAMYRRREFMEAILKPWCDDNIEGKEAEVLSNVLKNVTVHPDVGLVAILLLVKKMNYSKGRLSVLRSLIEKKFALKTSVINALVNYFFQVTVNDFSEHFTEKGIMPLSWFQTMNTFISYNYEYLNDDDLKKMLKVCRIQKHDKVTPAILAYLKLRSNSAPVELE